MIRIIDVGSRARTPLAEGHVRSILGPADEGTRVQVASEDVEAGRTCRLPVSDRTQVASILEGTGAKVNHA